MPIPRGLPLVVALAVACGGSSESVAPRVVASDSAGVAIVTIGGSLDELPQLRVADTLTLHGAPEDFFANNPSAVIPLPDGRTILSDGQNSAVFAADGSFVGPFVRRGRGPGEIEFLGASWLSAGDSLWVSDFRTRRLSLFDPSLEYVRSVPMPTGEAAGSVSPVAELGLDTVAVRLSQVANAPPLTEGPRDEVSATGLWLTKSDSLVRGRERLFISFLVGQSPGGDGIVVRIPPLSPAGVWLSLGRCAVFGYSSEWALEIEAPDSAAGFAAVGAVRASRGGARAVTPELRKRFIAGYTSRYAASRFAEEFERWYREQPFPESTPHFASILSSRDGALWVQRYRGPTTDVEDAWTIVDAGNARAWRLTLPPRTRLLGVDSGRALIAVRDEDDLETQHWLRLPDLDDVALPPACRRNNAAN